MFRPLALLVPACVAIICASACSSPAPPTERVIVDSNMSPGSHSMTDCPIAQTQWVEIGAFQTTTTPIDPIDNNGDDNGNGTVSIVCAVKGNDANGYDIEVSATLSGDTGGSLSITGHVTPTGTQMGISGVFQRADYGNFREDDCVISFAPNSNEGVAPGRLWGSISCPNIVNQSQLRTCDGEANFRFENCDQ